MSKQILDLMIRSALKSGKIIKKNFRVVGGFKSKTSFKDIVTTTDTASQKAAHLILKQGMRKLGFKDSEVGFVEEESLINKVRTHSFIIDPVDGTSNFASGIPYFCISIAYARNGVLQAGVILEPLTNTLYWAQKDKGAYMQSDLFKKKRLKLTPKPINSWMVVGSFPDVKSFNQKLEKLSLQVRGIRILGAIALDLCLMADDVLDGIVSHGCYVWDLTAGRVILKEAGGEIFDFKGKKLEFDWKNTKTRYKFIACHPENKKKLLNLIS